MEYFEGVGKIKGLLYNLATDKSQGFIPGIIKLFLLILSWAYSCIIRSLILLRRLKPRRLKCRVISVGNITLGGTGKTSLVEYIARYLHSQGHRVAVLSRGYGKDEPHMLTKNLSPIPVMVGSDRVGAARQAIRDYGVDTVILDDGFQQWGIKKDLEIVTIDAGNPFGNKHMLPRGILREPLSSLRRPDMVVITKSDLYPPPNNLENYLKQLNSRLEVFWSRHSPLGFYQLDRPDKSIDTSALKGRRAALFSGIGDPDSFERLVKGLGITVDLCFKFSDHHRYGAKDLENIIARSKEKDIETIITTDKDAARLVSLRLTALPLPILVLRIALTITKDEDVFRSRLLRLYPR